jgi:CheY-like chemotaxis protein
VNSKPATILHVEDDANYAHLMQCMVKQLGLPHQMKHVPNGAEAMAYIKGEGEYADRAKYPLPCLILADLKMPQVNGLELLNWVRSQSSLPHLPVVMLTSSEEMNDVKDAYRLGANSFLVKPPNPEEFKEMLGSMETFWAKYNVTEV